MAAVVSDTRETVLDVAERLVQARGFNGFSYATIAAEVGLTKAALHYHFATKAALGTALIRRYADRFGDALARIESEQRAPYERLVAYTRLYATVLSEQRMCLCGMLAAEYHTLPGDMRRAVLDFFDLNYAWLVRVLEAGREDSSLAFPGVALAAAQMIVGTLEGAMLTSRPYADPGRFDAVAAQLLAELSRPADLPAC
ncbi:MAG: TetR/AcrR family transcriptional regulator [Chloroflexi bacterium]|nr:TetR/AcrR family transcriptional regulator [Chloroflexota bacterium]